MIRHAAIVGLALCLSPSALYAQSTEFAVNTASADVHKSPSTGSPVIGTVARGTVFEVTRELGSWVKIAWPRAQDGVGYLHVSTGSMTRRVAPDQDRDAGFTSPQPASNSAPPLPTSVPAEPSGTGAPRTVSTRTVYVTPPSHIVGLGGRIGGSALGFGASARQWSRGRLGVQVDVSRYGLTASAAPGRVTSIQLGPSLLYSLRDRITDFVWVRPYLAAGAGLHRQTFSATPGARESVSDNSLGLQMFGGGEFTFASVPRFTVSTDLGYRWLRTPFAGFDPGGMGISVSGHWYIK